MGILSERIAIDLGTAYSVVARAGSDEYWRVPSSVAYDLLSRRAVAFGDDAKRMLGRCPERYQVILPLRDGVIADFEATNKYVSHLIKETSRQSFAFHYDVYLCVPWGATSVELKSYVDGFRSTRRTIFIVREPFAAAIGSGYDIFSDDSSTVVDMGGGTTEIATIRGGYMLQATTLRAGGVFCDQQIVDNLRTEHFFEIGNTTAEQIKMENASVWPAQDDYEFEVRGARRKTGLPEYGKVSTKDLRTYLESYALRVEATIHDHLSRLPTESQKSVEKSGIRLAGGTSELKGWKERLESRLKIPVTQQKTPALAVIRGMHEIIRHPKKYRAILKISEKVAGNYV